MIIPLTLLSLLPLVLDLSLILGLIQGNTRLRICFPGAPYFINHQFVFHFKEKENKSNFFLRTSYYPFITLSMRIEIANQLSQIFEMLQTTTTPKI